MKKRILLIISIFVVVLILFSSSYALLFKSNQTKKQEYTTGMLEITSETLSGSVTLNNPLPMSDSDGENTTPYVFRITNTGNLTYKFNIMLLSTTTDNQISSNYIKLKVNTDTPVKLNSLTDGIILSNITLKPGKSIDVTLRVWLSEDTPNTEIGKTFNAKITTEGEAIYTNKNYAKETLTNLGLTVSSGTPDFSKTSCSSGCEESTVGIYEAEDDIGTSYYFRGDVENNYVYFAGYYWRIIRINGDGSIRMIYAGTSAHSNGYDDSSTKDMGIGTSKFNSSYNDNAYVGYMYGTTGTSTYSLTHSNTNSSTIKTYIDNWYDTNIKNTNYEQYIVDTIYCNDRELSSGTGIGTSVTNYKAFDRLLTNKTPSLKCTQENDRFTVSSKVSGITGNGALTNPIALITADEVAYAGGARSTNNSKYYLYTKYYFWTMSPFYFDASFAYGFSVSSTSNLDYTRVNTTVDGVRPVISISPDNLEGTGTMSNPFKIPDPSPNAPDLVQGLIPVVYDESSSTWVKADSTNNNNSWYNYDNKLWANAVLVTSTNRSTYQSATPGTTISTSDILAFYVWIPRYKYKVWNISKQIGAESTYAYNAKTEGIDIVFEVGTGSTGTINCEYNYNVGSANGGVDLSTTTAETCTGSNGDYYTHPAFTFGSDELRGFWISKYEISSSSPTTTDGGGNVTNLTVRSLPNVNSWRYNTLSNFSTVIQNMQTSNNIYGLSTSRTNTDSHMLTNMEWGAVAYLTNSKYGRCTDGGCTEVTINNCSTYITGIGADSVSDSSSSTTCTTSVNQYNGAIGVLASTTGNITGVYDMSGGSNEYVMGNMSKVPIDYTFHPLDSGFSDSWYTTDTAKNLTTYAYGSTTKDQEAYNRGRLGDATAEVVLSTGGVGGWYSDYAYFPYTGYSWLFRGGYHSRGSAAGMFFFRFQDGLYYNSISSRATLVLLPS